jgi:hypothetical protein
MRKGDCIMKRFEPMALVYLFSLIKVIMTIFGYDIAPATWAQYEEILNVLCSALVALGVFAYNPFSKEEK